MKITLDVTIRAIIVNAFIGAGFALFIVMMLTDVLVNEDKLVKLVFVFIMFLLATYVENTGVLVNLFKGGKGKKGEKTIESNAKSSNPTNGA